MTSSEDTVVAIVLARGGSKSIPNKNLIDFCGRPLLAWTIEHAIAAEAVGSVWVSSDSAAILDLAESCGARSIRRPIELADDLATSESGWRHALDEIERRGHEVDLVVALQATSPVRQSEDIDRAIKDYYMHGYDSLFSGSMLDDFLIWRRRPNGELAGINYDYMRRNRRQDIEPQYLENGSMYLFRPNGFRRNQNRLHGHIGMYLMPIWKSFEIDEPESLEFCALLMRNYLLQRLPPAV